MWTLFVTLAQAQDLPDLNTNLYRVPMDARYTMWADDSSVAEGATARLAAGWLAGSFGAVPMGGGDDTVLVGNVLGFNLIGATSLDGLPGVRVGVDLPVYAMVTSDLEQVGGGGLGDLALEIKGRPVDPEVTGVGIGLLARATLPTGSADGVTGGTTVELAGIVDKELPDDTLVTLNVGYAISPKVEIDHLAANDTFAVRVGAGHAFTDTLGGSIDLATRLQLAGEGTGVPAEVMLGGWGRVVDDVVVRGGVGTGLTRGVGSPSARVVLALSYEPKADTDPDADGLLGRADRCPTVAEDVDSFEDTDGCPDDDNDKDGVVDAQDACPLVAEDVDTWKDADGCPDPQAGVRVAVVDEAGRSLPLASARLEGEKGGFDAKDGVVIEVDPGGYQLFAKSDGFEPNAVDFTVADGPEVLAKVVLKASIKPTTVSILVKDATGALIEASWTWNAGDSVAIPGGSLSTAVVPGRYPVVLGAPGYVAQSFTIEAAAGGTVAIEKVLLRETGTVHLSVVDPSGKPVTALWRADGMGGGELPGGVGDIVLPTGKRTVTASAEGFRSGSVEIDVAKDTRGEIQLTLEPAKVQVAKERIDIQGVIYFETAKDTIKPESFAILDEIAQVLVEHPELKKVRIEGHTDSRGSDAGNLKLSDKRAAAVVAYLINKGVTADRLSSVGYGESKPLDPAETEEAWAKNRRVEFIITERAE